MVFFYASVSASVKHFAMVLVHQRYGVSNVSTSSSLTKNCFQAEMKTLQHFMALTFEITAAGRDDNHFLFLYIFSILKIMNQSIIFSMSIENVLKMT